MQADEPQRGPDSGYYCHVTHLVRVSLKQSFWTGGWSALRIAARRFRADDFADLAAGLTYYSVLSLFPASAVLLSLIALVGSPESAVAALITILREVTGPLVLAELEPILVNLSLAQAAGWGLALGLAGAVWSASGYVGALGRAMNRVHDVREGRPAWKLRLVNLALTFVLLLVAAIALIGLVVSGPLASGVGAALGADDLVVRIWAIAKWPMVAGLVTFMVALLYYVTPDVERPGFRWISPGVFVALVMWATASAGFALYVANFAQYDRFYGTLAGAVLLLLWLWITNLALLFGAVLDAQARPKEVGPTGTPVAARPRTRHQERP